MYAEWFKWQVRAGAGQGTSSTEIPISVVALCWRREGGGMADPGRRWRQRMLNASHPHPPTYSGPQVLMLDRRRQWPPDPGPQHCPKPAGASRARESLYHAAGHDRNLAQIKLYNPTISTPELCLALHKRTRQKVGNSHLLLPMPSPQQAIRLSSPNVACLVATCGAALLAQLHINSQRASTAETPSSRSAGVWAGSITSSSRLYSCAAIRQPGLCSTAWCRQ